MASRSLSDVLRITRGMRVAVIGGGGKMTLLMSLGAEWALAGGRPLIVPTTRIADHEERGVPGVRTVALPAARSAWPLLSFLGGELLVVGRRGERPDVLESLHPDEIGLLVEQSGADLLLLKADGSRGRSLKAHQDGEPVVPLDTELVLAIAGVDVWGAELSADTVHRSELFAVRWGMTPGERLEDEAFLMALSDPAGYRAGVPPGARYFVFLNKADRPVRQAVAQRLAQALAERGVNEVAWGDIRRGEWTVAKRPGRG
jgi:probable selenium-dependent hydroxylase accessory protein YqeC